MLDGFSLDQIRIFIAAADQGSFSAAGRKLRRAQSVVSQTVATLEAQLGVRLFDRTGRHPQLTPQGRSLLADARTVVAGIDALKARAKGLASGLEPELSVVVDVMYPITVLTEAVTAFRDTFPSTPLRLYVEALGAVVQHVQSRVCQFGIMGTLPVVPPDCTRQLLPGVKLLFVAAPSHPLAAAPEPIPNRELARHIQLVLTDRSTLSQGRDYGVIAQQTWRLADLGAKLAFLRAGLGWGLMPAWMVVEDLARGSLVPIKAQEAPPGDIIMPMYAIHPTDEPLGPAGQWFVSHLTRP